MAIPFVTIQLDQPRRLRFGMRAMVGFEQETGIKLMSLDGEMSFETVAKMLWIMLREEYPHDGNVKKFEDVLGLVDEFAESITDVTEAVTEALQTAIATGKERKNAGKPKA